MARQNNPVVATIDCAECGTVATLHETKRGKGSGLLYKRCDCGCDQRTGKQVQERWRRELTPRPGHEHLKIEPEPEPEQPQPTTEPEPAPEPEKQQDSAPTPKPAGATMAGFMPLLMGGVILLLTAGRGPMS